MKDANKVLGTQQSMPKGDQAVSVGESGFRLYHVLMAAVFGLMVGYYT